jgi:hypothetical protein
MSEDCVRQLLREMRDGLDNLFLEIYKVSKNVNIYLPTLILLHRLLMVCKPLSGGSRFPLSGGRFLDYIALDCGGRYVRIYINIDRLEVEKHPLTRELYHNFLQLTKKIPIGSSPEEEKLLKQLGSEFNTFEITDGTAIGNLSLSSVQYRAPSMKQKKGRYEFYDPSINFKVLGTRFLPPPLMKWVMDVELTLHIYDSQREVISTYKAQLGRVGAEETFGELAPFEPSPEEVIKLGREGVCAIKDKILGEFNNFVNLFKGLPVLIVTYLLY